MVTYPSDFDSALGKIYARLNTLETNTDRLNEGYSILRRNLEHVAINSEPISYIPTIKVEIGKKVFHIKHFWLRYEFAPSRGQIHAHILAIHEISSILQPYFELRTDKKKQEVFLHNFMEKEFGMTAWFPESFS